ncbi:MAG: homoserine dehydrogenase [Tumebacillaceae bacterium]
MNQSVVKVGLLGLGTVGSGVVKMVQKESYGVEIKKILVRDLNKARAVEVDRSLLTQNVWEIVRDPEIRVVIEVMGGESHAYEVVKEALKLGKHVITANKDLIALHGAELRALARANGVELLFEAAVAGAVPIIRALENSFAGDRILEVMGIVNGTTNFILSKMTDEGASYEEVLREAQQLGYAESDPYADVSGLDAARKMAILASIAFGEPVSLGEVKVQGIEQVTQADIQQATEQNGVIKLIGRATRSKDGLSVSVGPTMVADSHPLSQVSDVFNAVYVYGDALGEAMFYGRGAGMMPTGSAVVGDLLAVLRRSKMVAQENILRLAGGRA